jgi:fluoride ion exporter CrcB/FEX
MIPASNSVNEAEDESVPGSGAVEMTAAGSNSIPEPDLHAVITEATAPARAAWYRFFYPHRHKPQSDYLGTSSARSPPRGRRKHARRTAVPTTGDDDELPENHDPLQPPVAECADDEVEDDDSEIEHSFEEDSSQEREHRRKDAATPDMNDPDVAFVHNFWTTFDDILILSIFTQLGIVFRLASSIWFTIFDGVFSNDSPLFVNLPLNCLSCFLMGLLCSGERLMEIIATRFSPPRTQHDVIGDDTDPYHDDDEHDEGDGMLREGSLHGLERPPVKPSLFGFRRRGRRKKSKDKTEHFVSWQPPVHLNEELRDVQLLALERRIRMSKCLVLFPVRKEDVDVMEHYFQEGYKKNSENGEEDGEEEEELASLRPRRAQYPRLQLFRRPNGNFDDLALEEEISGNRNGESPRAAPERKGDSRTEIATALVVDPLAGSIASAHVQGQKSSSTANGATHSPMESGDPSTGEHAGGEFNADYIAEFTSNVHENVQENIDRFRRVNLADGWDAGTTAEAMSDDLMLGLRDGFCGALSSFSSWNSAMVSLLRNGHIGEAFVGYMLGLQLPIIAYRFGQHVAVYIFVWRTRRETRIDERRGGYGIRVAIDEESDRDAPEGLEGEESEDEKKDKNEMPSLRAVITAIFIMALVTQCTSISFFKDPTYQQIALSLLFSPLGVFARWRLAKLNNWRPTFPVGTFSCNILACALSGSLGRLLAGNPGPRERIVLVSIVAGFGGTLSSVAAFIVEVLAGVDPILFRFDGFVYAAASIGCAVVVGFVFSASEEWADQTESDPVVDDGT